MLAPLKCKVQLSMWFTFLKLKLIRPLWLAIAVACLTKRIKALGEHSENHRKDKQCKRGLQTMQSHREKLLR